jgi:hypothetical protein
MWHKKMQRENSIVSGKARMTVSTAPPGCLRLLLAYQKRYRESGQDCAQRQGLLFCNA